MNLRSFASTLLVFITCYFQSQAQQIGDLYSFGKEYIIEGIREYERVNYSDAVEQFKKVQPGDSLYALARYEMALAQHADSLNTEALENVDWVIANDRSTLLDALLLKATILDYLDRDKESIAVLDYAVKEFGQSHRPFYERAVVKADMKDFKGALEDLAESLTRNYLHPRTHMLIAVLANDAERSALATMASAFAAQTVDGNAEYLNYAVGFLEGIANKANKQKYKDIPAETFAFCDHLAYIDEIVYSKTALSKNYKSKVKGDYNLSKQLQVVSESLAKESVGDDVILRFYVNYYQQIWNKKHFEGMVAAILGSIDNPNTQSVAKKYKAKINLFNKDVLTIIHTGRSTIKCTNNGRTLEGYTYPANGYVFALGDLTPKITIDGQAYYFYKNGVMSAEGKTSEEEVKSGPWKYYYENGILRKVEEYENGKLNGTQILYAESGAISEKTEMKDGKSDGRVITYNADGSKDVEYVVNGEGVIQDSLFHYDEHNVLKYAMTYKGMNKSDRIIFYNPNGTVSYSCKLVNEKINDDVEVKNEDGKIAAKGKIVEGEKEGEWQYFYESGKLKEVGSFKGGKQEGEWKSYHENEKQSAVELYKGGKLNGISILYDEQGNKKAEILYKNGKNLDYKVFDASGKVIDEMKSEGGSMYVKVYNDLRIVVREGKVTKEKSEGEWKYYFDSGVLKFVCNYKNDMREGIATEYHTNGVKYREVYYMNDELQGLFREYDEGGNLIEEGYYDNGQLDGPLKEYFPNGQLQTYSFYNKGVINGESKDYNNEGKLIVITEYSYGVRVKTTSYLADGTTKVSYTPGGNGLIEVYTQSGFKRYEGQLKENTLTKTTREFDFDGGVYSELDWLNGKRHGNYKRYNFGQLEEEGRYEYGLRTGQWMYYENGKKTFVIDYKEGDRHGRWESYLLTGKLDQTREYRFDERHGPTTYYDENGKPYFKINFVDGVMVSYAIVGPGADGQFQPEVPIQNGNLELVVKYVNGAKAREFKFVNGVYEGAVKLYSSNGKLISEATYVKGNENGVSKTYYPSGTLKSEIENKDDREHGSYKTYHENGKVHIQATKFYNIFCGPYKEYDKSGKVVRDGVMEMGKFIPNPTPVEPKPEAKPEAKPAPKTGAKK